MKDVFDCQAPDCPELADTDAGYCFYHQHEIKEGRMSVCKIAGCTQPAVDKAGIYALLCADHKAEKQARGTVPAAASGNGTVQSLRSLMQLARDVDKAANKVTKAEAALRTAQEDHAAVERSYQEAVGRVLHVT